VQNKIDGLPLDCIPCRKNIEAGLTITLLSVHVLQLTVRTGLPEGLFSYQSPNLGIFWRVCEWKMLVYFMMICNILRTHGIFYGCLV
jgi:hypothetical protein